MLVSGLQNKVRGPLLSNYPVSAATLKVAIFASKILRNQLMILFNWKGWIKTISKSFELDFKVWGRKYVNGDSTVL